jgi:hypothetical protein
VPIISLGSGTYVGAAQVVGVPDKIKEVKAVAELEATFHFKTQIRGKALIPIATRKPTGQTVKAVSGVGVSAVIDFRL